MAIQPLLNVQYAIDLFGNLGSSLLSPKHSNLISVVVDHLKRMETSLIRQRAVEGVVPTGNTQNNFMIPRITHQICSAHIAQPRPSQPSYP